MEAHGGDGHGGRRRSGDGDGEGRTAPRRARCRDAGGVVDSGGAPLLAALGAAERRSAGDRKPSTVERRKGGRRGGFRGWMRKRRGIHGCYL